MFLVLSLASFCPHVNPFQFPLNFLLAFRFMLAFQRHTLIFLFKPRRIISLKRITFATVKFKNPAGNFIKEVTVVSYGNYSSRIVMKMLFKPCNSFRIKMVRRFVQKKNIRLLQKKTAQCNTAAFTPRKHVYNLISRRTAESIHCKLKVVVQVPCIQSIKFFLNFALTSTKLINISIRIAKSFINLIKFSKKVCNFLYPFLYTFHYSFARFKIWLLFKIADCIPRCQSCFASKISIFTSKNLKKRRFTRTVWTDYTDFSPIKI